jgi:hypothetical protein
VGLREALAGAGRGLQREADLARPAISMQRKVATWFLHQAQLFDELFRRLRHHFPLAEAGGIPIPPWEPLWDVVADSTSEDLIRIVESELPAAMRSGAAATAADIGIGTSFTLSNPRAVAYIEAVGARLVTQVNETTRGRIRDIVAEGAREGRAYSRVARSIIDEFERMAVPKPQRHIRNRAELIAVTELGEAYEESGAIVSRDLMSAGLSMEKYWSNIGDDRVTPACIANTAAGWIPESQPFPSGHHHPLRFPGCRCASLRRVAE